jgi:hypothetical protein
MAAKSNSFSNGQGKPIQDIEVISIIEQDCPLLFII